MQARILAANFANALTSEARQAVVQEAQRLGWPVAATLLLYLLDRSERDPALRDLIAACLPLRAIARRLPRSRFKTHLGRLESLRATVLKLEKETTR